MSKVIFSDLDGTLLSEDKSISEGNRQAISRVTAAGHSFVIATGRPFESAFKIAAALNLDGQGCYIVSYNGGYVYDCGKKKALVNKTLSMDTVRELFHRAWDAGIYVHTYQDGDILTRENSEELIWYASNTNLNPNPRADVLDYLTKAPNKAIVIDLHDTERLMRFRDEQAEWAKGRCRMIFSSPQYLEVVPEGVSKQEGIKTLMEYLGVKTEDTIAIGDETNDIEMLQGAGLAVAVQNANPTVKAVADIVTAATNDEDAIAEVIDRHVLV